MPSFFIPHSSIFEALISLSAQLSTILNGFSQGLTHKKLEPLSLGEEEAPLGRNSENMKQAPAGNGLSPDGRWSPGGLAFLAWSAWWGGPIPFPPPPKAFSPLHIQCQLQCDRFFWLENTKNLDLFSEIGAGERKKTCVFSKFFIFFQGQLEEGRGVICNLCRYFFTGISVC